MRLILGISCLLLGAGMVSCRLEGQPALWTAQPPLAEQRHANDWVRTENGWERVDSWYVAEIPRPQLHPLVVAAGQGLVSLLGLAACQREHDAASGG